ncbi:sugar ABC transporter substrate-binding protein [Bifidobacterium simiiventris]|uniref:sugar ABC transporter substrate-binding protein n=1 Tax=Bifidobacterium simiiventris TaxID=2834434 RepID=UPI001C565CB6|nr:sugar ABC transporter substrate-binding protein [Bifidobacterium simiiventris]MBW3077813.1 sugar ABC transporter substrate-binding protein [Bifidobacterium simiiventris]
MSRTVFRRLTATLACMAACLTLAACEPAGRAVGDTQDSEPEVAHIGKIKQDMLIGLVGAAQSADVDRMAMDAFDTAGVNAVYVPVADMSDPDATARRGVTDLIDRRATVIVINGLQLGSDNTDDWNDVLRKARGAGIPVALLDPTNTPVDKTLFAATLTLNDRAADAQPIAQALADIMDDKPHEREIMVSTMNATELNRP